MNIYKRECERERSNAKPRKIECIKTERESAESQGTFTIRSFMFFEHTFTSARDEQQANE